jgi:hypothetical protein
LRKFSLLSLLFHKREVCENYNLNILTGRMVTIGTQGLHPLLHLVHLQPTKAVRNLVAMTAHQAVVLVVAARNQE